MKTLIIPNSLKQIEACDAYIDGFIVGLNGLSVNMNLYLTIEEINNIKTDKEIFVALNKNIHNADLDNLKMALTSLTNIKGILYYDAAVVRIYNQLKPKYDLVWSQEHLATSAVTCNYWHKNNVNYAYLSAEITLNEILEISESTEMKLIVPIFGHLPMFVSKRHLVKNYLEYYNLEDNSKINYLEKEGNIYPIIDNEVTEVYSTNILNGISVLEELEGKIDYVTLNAFNIDDDQFLEVCRIYKTKKDQTKISEMFSNIDTGFLHKETIYRVKKND